MTNAYTRRLQLYRGEIGPEAVVTSADTDDVQVATLAYGLGNWYLLRGDNAQARRWFERSIQAGGWPALGFIVSEAERRRLRGGRQHPPLIGHFFQQTAATLRPPKRTSSATLQQPEPGTSARPDRQVTARKATHPRFRLAAVFPKRAGRFFVGFPRADASIGV